MKLLLRLLRFLAVLSWQTDRRRLIVGGSLLLAGYLAAPVVPLMLKGLTNAALDGHGGAAGGWATVAAMALICELMLGHFAHLSYFELGELIELALNRRLLARVNGAAGLAAFDRPELADDLDLLRQDVVRMRDTVHASLSLVCLAAQLLLTAVLLAELQPALLALPLAAVIPVLTGKRAERAVDTGRQQSAPATGAIRHLRGLAASAAAQKEIRIAGAQGFLLAKHQGLHRQVSAIQAAAYRRQAVLRSAGQLCFALAYAGSLLLVFRQAQQGQASVGDVVLVVTLAGQVSGQVSTGLDLLSKVYAAALGIARFERVTGLLAGPPQERVATVLAPSALTGGITLREVSFAYPGGREPVLRDMDLTLPAGRSIALVGENGAGKSTLIKLLNGLYQPTSGSILLDGRPLAEVGAQSWHARTANLFQDFARVNLTAQQSIGIGQLDRIDSAEAVHRAVELAGAADTVASLPERLDSLLGKEYGPGTELSGGQWQRIGLARTLMRPEALLMCLDEPASALDPQAEALLCDAYQHAAAHMSATVGGITVFVTHRLSTVRMADTIVLLEEGRVCETGSHHELLALGGRYAELFALQSKVYT
ncbi:ABC transporter ATP-binding protein [Kitasatospora sp. NPDC087315]|uniref:ABC transporter ATP-binding protein n=1 Tax=Kitasatospora sp. NPDC087315 TaxID=3364069 RepID=UPI00380C0C67